VEVWQTSSLRRLRLGKKKKEEERKITNNSMKIPESPARGLQSSPPACTASLIVGSSKARDVDLDLGSG